MADQGITVSAAVYPSAIDLISEYRKAWCIQAQLSSPTIAIQFASFNALPGVFASPERLPNLKH